MLSGALSDGRVATVDAGLAKITPSMDEAAALSCVGADGTLLRVHGPLRCGKPVDGRPVVFVDVMKEFRDDNDAAV